VVAAFVFGGLAEQLGPRAPVALIAALSLASAGLLMPSEEELDGLGKEEA
jgi:hypothetical protein